MHIPPLATMGPRIMILGPTNSGKSTLAIALGEKIGAPAIHLDRFRHLPNTMYEQRPDDEFKALHDEAAAGESWIMDGNYSKHYPVRLPRTTGIIVLDESYLVRNWRYVNRTLFQKNRLGGLEGNKDKLNWDMFHWLWTTRNRSEGLRQWASKAGKPYVLCHNTRETNALYAAWNLTKPHA